MFKKVVNNIKSYPAHSFTYFNGNSVKDFDIPKNLVRNLLLNRIHSLPTHYSLAFDATAVAVTYSSKASTYIRSFKKLEARE